MTAVSVVLPCYNEAKEIGSAIDNLEGQTFPDREILVVDDGSTDGSQQIALETVARRGYTDVRLLNSEHRGLTHARNVGINAARGDVVFFAECDCTYDSSYINKALHAFQEDPGASAVCLTGAPNMVRSTIATECLVIENKIQHKLLELGRIRPFYAWVFKKEALTSLGGFDERLFQGEDKDFFRRLTLHGYRVVWVPGINWWHRRDQTLLDISKKSIKRGESRLLYLKKHGLFSEAVKGLMPMWLFASGIALYPFQPYIGIALISLVLLAFLARSLWITLTGWAVVRERKWFLAYPLFVFTRNFSLGIGYSIGMVRILAAKLGVLGHPPVES